MLPSSRIVIASKKRVFESWKTESVQAPVPRSTPATSRIDASSEIDGV
jgi:hypothetical protein